jgi:hypothetical protein
MTIAEIIAALKGHLDTKENRKAVLAAIQGDTATQPLYQDIYNLGFGQATKDKGEEVATLKTQLQEATDAKTQAEQTLAAERAKAPDLETIRTQHAAALQKEKDDAQKREDALKAQLKTERESSAVKELRRLLVEDPDSPLVEEYADLICEKAGTRGRLRFKDDGTIAVVQEGTEVELQVGEGQTPLTLLAAEIRKGTKPTWIRSGADGGSGVGTGNSLGASPKYDAAAVGKEMAKQQKASAENAALAFR